jgi:hypothetical protein
MIPYRLDQSGSPEKNFQRPKKTIKTPKTPFSLSIAAIPAESIPFIGVAVLIADTGYELYSDSHVAPDCSPSALHEYLLSLGKDCGINRLFVVSKVAAPADQTSPG